MVSQSRLCICASKDIYSFTDVVLGAFDKIEELYLGHPTEDVPTCYLLAVSLNVYISSLMTARFLTLTLRWRSCIKINLTKPRHTFDSVTNRPPLVERNIPSDYLPRSNDSFSLL